MAATHLAYPDLALDKFSGTDPDQDAESFIQLIERKINFALGDAPLILMRLPTTISAKKLSSPLYSEAPLPSGMEAPSKLLRHGKIFELTLLLDSLMDEINFATDWKLSTVFEETERKFVNSFTESKRQWTKVGLMI